MAENLAAVLHGVRDLRIEERPVPQPGPRQVLVEVHSVGVCGSDVHYYEDGRIGPFIVDGPLVLGHEASGVIVGRGSEARRHRLGQRVAIEPGVPCRRCRECRLGWYNLCGDVEFFATPPIDGAFVRYVTIDEDFVHSLPALLSDDAGALIEPLSVGVWANRKAGTSIGSRVLVTGAGPIGVLAAAAARAAGASSVTVLDGNNARLACAERLGFEPLGNTEDLGSFAAGILIECTGAAAVLAAGIRALSPGGTAVVVGMGPGDEQPLPTATIQAKELTVTGVFRYANTYEHTIALASSGQIDLEELVGRRLPLGRTEDALLTCHTMPEVLKTIVDVTAD